MMLDSGPAIYTSTNAETYWADEDDPDMLMASLVQRRSRFYQRLVNSGLYARICRNWNYYIGRYPGVGGQGQDIGRMGPEGSMSAIAVNHFRSILRMLITYTVQSRPAWDTRAIDDSDRALKQTEFAARLLDYYMEKKGAEKALTRSVEHSVALGVGLVKTCWDPSMGNLLNADPNTGGYEFEGDIHFDTPSLLEAVYDYSVRNWEDRTWDFIHSFKNKWDVAERYHEYRDDIIALHLENRNTPEDLHHAGLVPDSEDLIDYWEFYHRPTPSMPDGRYFAMAGDKVALTPEKMPYPYHSGCKVLHRISPADILLSSFGYSPGFDLQGLQEALNAEFSMIVTNHNNLGPTKMWFKNGEQINSWDWEPGTNAVQTDTKPEPLVMCQTAPEILQFPAVLTKEMEYVSGVNAVSRGQPEASYRSGAALALIDSKTNQFNAPLGAAFNSLLSSVGTSIIQILRHEMSAGNLTRLVALAGPGRASLLKEFTAKDLDAVDHVVVMSGNSMSRTLAGKLQIADTLMTNGLLTTPEEYFTVLETGQLKPLTETIDSQNSLVHQENEALRLGQPVTASVTDNHLLHIKRHTAPVDSLDVRNNSPAFIQNEAHISQHMQMLMNPVVQALQIAMKYATPIDLQLITQLSMPQAGPATQPPSPKGKGSPPRPRMPEGNPNYDAGQPPPPGGQPPQ